MKRRLAGLLALAALWGCYLLVRYPLLALHGMYQFPLLLALLGSAVIVVGGILPARWPVGVFTVGGYLVGFFVGVWFSAESLDAGGGRQSNLWVIWLICYLLAIAVGCLVALTQKRHR